MSWAEGGTPRPRNGEYAAVQLDAEGYAVRVEVRAWRPVVGSPGFPTAAGGCGKVQDRFIRKCRPNLRRETWQVNEALAGRRPRRGR